MTPLIDIIKRIRPEFDFASSKNFMADGMLDSFDLVTLVAALDKAYNVSIRGVEIVPENFQNLDTITALLRTHGVTL